MTTTTRRRAFVSFAFAAAIGFAAAGAQAGPHGSEFDLSFTPAHGGMEGVGQIRPQDAIGMLFGNPASITSVKGKNMFTVGGSYISMDLKASSDVAVPNASVTGPFQAQSRNKDVAAPHAGAVQRLGDKLVAGFGFTAISGLGGDFRQADNIVAKIISELKLFGANMTAGYAVTNRISVGGAFTIGIGSLVLGTTEASSTVNNFGVGGTVGATFDAGIVKLGGAVKSPIRITYEDVVQTTDGGGETFADFTLEQPLQLNFGVATTDAFMKDTYFEVDLLWKNYSAAEGYQDFWQNSWKLALGASHKLPTPVGALTLRAGYSYTSDLLKDPNSLGSSVGSLTSVRLGAGAAPLNPDFIRLFQATAANGYWRHGISGGVAVQALENLRFDLYANYAFGGETDSGPFHIDGKIFSAGMGFTWTF